MKSRVSFSARPKLTLWAVLVVVVVGTAVVATMATAKEGHQFRAGGDMWYVAKEDGWHVWSGVGYYSIDHKTYDQTSDSRFHVTGKKLVAYVTIITTETGDRIYYTTEMTRPDNRSEEWFGTYVITGGTGRFANATGSGTDGLPSATYPGGPIGTISF